MRGAVSLRREGLQTRDHLHPAEAGGLGTMRDRRCVAERRTSQVERETFLVSRSSMRSSVVRPTWLRVCRVGSAEIVRRVLI